METLEQAERLEIPLNEQLAEFRQQVAELQHIFEVSPTDPWKYGIFYSTAWIPKTFNLRRMSWPQLREAAKARHGQTCLMCFDKHNPRGFVAAPEFLWDDNLLDSLYEAAMFRSREPNVVLTGLPE